MRARFSRGFGIAMMLTCSLIGSTVVAGSASAAPSAASTASAPAPAPAPVPGELFTSYLHRAVLPNSPQGCLPGTVSKVLPDGKRQLVADIPCDSRAVIPKPVTLPAGFESQPGSALVAKVAALSGVSSAEAAETIAAAAGVPVSQLSTRTVADLGRSILLTAAKVSPVTGAPGVSEKTNVCARSSTGQSACAQIADPFAEALFWGVVGGTVGGSVGGAVGAVVGAIVGFIIGLL